MDNFIKMSSKDRRLAYAEVEAKMNLHDISVEKDFWVCWTLRELFSLPEIGKYLTFKGGTSLSKAWKLIERFSEDIDLVIDKSAMGIGSPEQAPSKKQRKLQLEALTDASKKWVQDKLKSTLSDRFSSILGQKVWKIEVDPDMKDGQCLLFHYPSDFSLNEIGYIRPVVKIELGARSDNWPSQEKMIQSYVTEVFPQLVTEAVFSIRVLDPERTFLEKATLLHEETFRPISKPRKLRMARHYYDLWCLIRAGVGARSIKDQELFKRVVEHRSLFFNWSWVDYSTMRQGNLRLIPLDSQISEWRGDYEAMKSEMFFGKIPSFEEILETVGRFEKEFNLMSS